MYKDKRGLEHYNLMIFRLGKNKYQSSEQALAITLTKNLGDKFVFDFQPFIIPPRFPQTKLYEWEEIDVNYFPKLSEISDYSGYYYPAQDLGILKDKFKL